MRFASARVRVAAALTVMGMICAAGCGKKEAADDKGATPNAAPVGVSDTGAGKPQVSPN